MNKNLLSLSSGLFFVFLGALSGSFVSYDRDEWYAALSKPGLVPPDWVFPLVWTVLYFFLGWIFAKLCQKDPFPKKLIALFTAMMAFNLLWSPLFFYAQKIHFALIDLIIMWVLTSVFVVKVKEDSMLFALSLPYYIWISFALYLNASLLVLNPL